MSSFDVLNRATPIHRHYLLEASAGTGKTFSIENLVVRFILEEVELFNILDSILIEKILVVTFTRAATRDLKERIRGALQKGLNDLKTLNHGASDYILAYLEKGESAVKKAIKRLENALFGFDQAQIFTIHAFCAKMLRDYGFEAGILFDDADGQLTDSQILCTIRDFFRTRLHSESYSQGQLSIVLKFHKQQIEKLEDAILRQINRGYRIAQLEDFSASIDSFKKLMGKLKNELNLKGELILADYDYQVDFYTKIPLKERGELRKKIAAFSTLFDQTDWDGKDLDRLIQDGICLVKALNPHHLKKNAKKLPQGTIHYPRLVERLLEELNPLIEHISNPYTILARMVYDCRKMIRRYAFEEELMRHDDILHAMAEGLKSPSFVDRVREKYQIAIIDEFQDTDQVQWKIFETLFLNLLHPKNYLYLVGDPKQSIYAFRQADIYTYLAAANTLGKEHQASLDTNFRSTTPLVQALNTLFKQVFHFMPLPRIKGYLDYPKVRASNTVFKKTAEDSRGSIHFCLIDGLDKKGKPLPQEIVEEKTLFPYIAKEIIRLHTEYNIPFFHFAVLVKDYVQSNRLAACLKKWGLPIAIQKLGNLTDSVAFSSMKELLRAFINPKNESAIKSALGGPLFQWTHSDIRRLNDPAILENVLTKMYYLRAIFVEKGFGPFFKELMSSEWKSDQKTMSENLLSREDGEQFYHDCLQIAELLIEHQALFHTSFEGLLFYLEEFKQFVIDGDEKIKKRMDARDNAIQILTLHMSKGLEFEIVFPVGLCKRTPDPGCLIPVNVHEEVLLTPVTDPSSPTYLHYCDESDSEKMRQLYVGMTRAKERLYLPIQFCSPGKPPERGTASPMELFAVGLLNQIDQFSEIYEAIPQVTGADFCSFLDNQGADISYEWMDEQQYVEQGEIQKEEVILIPPKPYSIPGKPLFIHSYTGLSKMSKKGAQLHLDFSAPIDFKGDVQDRHTLPSSKQTGILLHAILEKIPLKEGFKAVHPSELAIWTHPFLKGTLYESWEPVFCEILYDALHVKLGSFSLDQINPHQTLREMSFLYPANDTPLLEEFSLENGFLKGSIDLFFEYEDKFYLVDWKSNWLGPSMEDYHLERLQCAMVENRFDLQASIYREAIKKYLTLCKKEFESSFGGIYYLFLRGVESAIPSQSGIFYLP